MNDDARNGYYLVNTSSDGAYSKVVKGIEAVYRVLMSEVVFDNIEAVPEEDAMHWKADLEDPDHWQATFDYPFWNFEVQFEDGDLRIQRVLEIAPFPVSHTERKQND